MAKSQTIGSEEIQAAVLRLVDGISSQPRDTTERVILLGIANGGIELAHRVGRLLQQRGGGTTIPVGILDISFHRDDIGRHPIPKEFVPTQIPADVHGAHVILVDDVLFSGRTVKAALDELFDHGRPSKVELAVLVDRGGRRLPFAANYVGLTLATNADQKVVVTLDPTNPKRDSIRVLPASPAAQKSAL